MSVYTDKLCLTSWNRKVYTSDGLFQEKHYLYYLVCMFLFVFFFCPCLFTFLSPFILYIVLCPCKCLLPSPHPHPPYTCALLDMMAQSRKNTIFSSWSNQKISVFCVVCPLLRGQTTQKQTGSQGKALSVSVRKVPAGRVVCFCEMGTYPTFTHAPLPWHYD